MILGYTIKPEHARQGYIYEVVQELIKYFDNLGFENMFAEALPENVASIGLLKKLQFSFIKTNEYGEEVYRLILN